MLGCTNSWVTLDVDVDSLSVGQLPEHRGVGALSPPDQGHERHADSDAEPHVNVDDDDREERGQPDQGVELARLPRRRQVLDLHEHALERHEDDRRQYALKVKISNLFGRVGSTISPFVRTSSIDIGMNREFFRNQTVQPFSCHFFPFASPRPLSSKDLVTPT